MLAYFLAKKGVVDVPLLLIQLFSFDFLCILLLVHIPDKSRAMTVGCSNMTLNSPQVMPKTLIADIEDQEDLDHLPRRVSKWMGKESTGDQLAKKSVESGLVLKASNANRGEHIYLVQSAAEVSAIHSSVLQNVTEWVIQPYLKSQLLDGRKFHVRCHFVVVGCPRCGASRAWLHDEAVILLASQPFTEDLTQIAAHLTNMCQQEKHPDYNEGRQILLLSLLKASAAEEIVGRNRAPGCGAKSIQYNKIQSTGWNHYAF